MVTLVLKKRQGTRELRLPFPGNTPVEEVYKTIKYLLEQGYIVTEIR